MRCGPDPTVARGATTRVSRGERCWTRRLIVPSLPASVTSFNEYEDLLTRLNDVMLQLGQLDLRCSQRGLFGPLLLRMVRLADGHGRNDFH